jgi:uncharacterized membrane-anchored protein
MTSSPFVQWLAQLAEPWQAAYADSVVLGVIVLYAHFAALMVGGGMAIAMDRATLRAIRGDDTDRKRQLDALHGSHPVVITALVVLALSGLLMAAADIETFAGSIPFLVKISLVVLLLVNGFVLTRTEHTLRRAAAADIRDTSETTALWRRLRTTSVISIVLWLATALAGVVLGAAA